MTYDMDVARLVGIQGRILYQTKQFCYFCCIKSKTSPTRYLLKFRTISEAVTLLKYPTQKKPPHGGFFNLKIKNFATNNYRSRTTFVALRLP